MISQTFEQVLAIAQTEGSLTSAWRKLVATKFFVAKAQLLSNASGTVLLSEQRELLDEQAQDVAALSGADIIRRLHPQAGLQVVLNGGMFVIAPDKVDWLRKGIEQSLARAAAARAVAPTVAAPPTAPVNLGKPLNLGTPVQRNQGAMIDIAALKPRFVNVAKLGLEFYVPGNWTESAMSGGLRLRDSDGSTVVEVSGAHREGVTLDQWQQTRLALVQHERRYLVQDGASYPLDGEGWQSRVKGSATEFTGVFPGDETESRYLLACIMIEGTAVSVAVRARADEFEILRQVYKWLLGRVDIRAEAAIEQAPPLPGNNETFDPGVFGNTMQGRIGRMRAMAYSFPIMAALVLVGVVGALVFSRSPVMASIFMLALFIGAMYTGLRLIVLRLHDVNMSGKWIAGYIVLMGIAGAMQKPWLLAMLGLLFWVSVIVITCVIPGTDGDNDYGPPPGPNSTLIQVGAVLFILLNVASLTGGARNGKQGADTFSTVLAGKRAGDEGARVKRSNAPMATAAPMQTFLS